MCTMLQTASHDAAYIIGCPGSLSSSKVSEAAYVICVVAKVHAETGSFDLVPKARPNLEMLL